MLLKNHLIEVFKQASLENNFLLEEKDIKEQLNPIYNKSLFNFFCQIAETAPNIIYYKDRKIIII